MMRQRRWLVAAAMAATLAGCGGDGGGGTSGGIGPTVTSGTVTPAPSPTPTASCSLRGRQDWAAAQLNEWYLFPETLPANLDPSSYSTVEAYIDALTATARAQRRDRYFTYLTSIASEDAYYDSGSSAGLGVRLSTDAAARRAFIAEAFEGAPALAAGLDRGTEILAIGTTSADLRTVSSIIASEGTGGVSAALGPNTAGITRVLRVTDPGGTVRDVTITKAAYDLTPVSSRYGGKILEDGGQRYGYVNLRTFIGPADPALRTIFAQFRSAGIDKIIVDLRYNGGGLVSIAELMGNLLGGKRSTGDVFSYTAYRASKSSQNSTRYFSPQPQSIGATRIAFIGTGASASASELVMNAFIPYLHGAAALIGTNTYGKPVGQIAIDRPSCDDRLRVIAFATQNAARQGGYFDGLAGTMEATCRAADDTSKPLGDPQEASTRAAIDFLAGRPCSAIAGDVTVQAAHLGNSGNRTLLTPDRPDTAQREVPGLF
ncbi:C-terminal processing protease CtpA/Prc [Sphingomonas jinjuensis]|uniref:C-terminal processing protease CtpA/Prc n=1 Tax=Sphingomonas jinjuensis TaxID=535907 RepID=A0A840FEN3_9SPHN|nr:C-terminal processing protease CtpA/Prc [Sphingomonas jinjuensis]